MSDTTLILLPGLLCDAALWAAQVEGLSDVAEVRVADLTGADSMSGLAQNVLQGAPDSFALAGLSMGGYVAQEILRQAPGRVTHLAFLDTNARADQPEQSARRRALVAQAQDGGFADVAAGMLPALVHPDHVETPHIRDTWTAMAERTGVQGYVNQQTAIMGRQDGRAGLAAVDCPTLVLCGEDDALTPVEVHQEMVDAIGTNASLVTIEHCGHLSPLEQPRAVTDAMRAWLRGT